MEYLASLGLFFVGVGILSLSGGLVCFGILKKEIAKAKGKKL
jgi:hypothetical protein